MSLIEAVEKNDIVSVKALIARRTNLSEHNGDGWTPLHEAAEKGFVECAKALLDAKADLEAKSSEGLTPLIVAVVNRRLDCVKVCCGWSSLHTSVCNVPSSAPHRVQGKYQFTRQV